MTTSSLQGNLLTSSLQTLPNEGTNNIGKTEKGQTIQTSPVPTFSTEKFSNTTTSMTDKRHGHHKQQINSTTSMSTLMSQDLCEINKASNITEHTIFTSNFQKSISTQFAKEVESLRNIVNSLDEKLKNETDSSQKIAIYDALKEINGFITRYQNTGLGGFDKVKASEIRTSELLFKNLPKDLHSQTQEYETIKKDLEDTEKKVPKTAEEIGQLKTQIEEHETKYKNAIKEGILRAQEIVAKNLEMLTALIKDNDSVKLGMSGQGIEQTFNILQANAMSGWIVNDIVPKLENVDKACGTTLANQLKTEGDSQILNKIQILNNATRALPMFSEITLDSLLEDTDVKASEMVNKMIEEYKTKKIGIRGRSEQEPKPKTARIPLKENLQGDLANDPGLTNSFSPNPTCSRDAVPKDFIDGLNYAYLGDNSSYEDQINAGLILKDLEAKGAVKFNTDSNSYESVQSFGAIIDDAGLPTYCSVSGTTTELLACMYYKMDDKAEIHATFEFLLNIARGEDATIPNGFVKIFTPIALFMEAGRFHTSAEVLGGMYGTAVAWANVQAENSEPKDMKSMIDGFKNILNFYKGHMNEFWGQVSQPQLQVQPQN